MLTGPFLDRNWMGENKNYNEANIVMLGLPFDGTVSYRPGSRFAPEQIRLIYMLIRQTMPDKILNVSQFSFAFKLQCYCCNIAN